jgi:1,4-dihydroxy-2-naphthoate octaprenyltransferase
VLLPAISLGFLSMGVLNLNNMRDIDNDIRSGKHTLAARLGLKKAKKYHVLLVMGAIFCVTVYVFLNYISPANFLFVIAVVPIVRDLLAVMSTSEQALLDPFLKKLALSTLLFTILFGVGILM